MSGVRAGARAHAVPSIADVAAIGACRDPTLRNLRITHAYHLLSRAIARTLDPGANWCTFATWASRQAGQTIRGDDLGRKIEEVFSDADAVQLVVGRLRGLRRAIGRHEEAAAVLRAVGEACAPLRIAARVADAVARGNKKVFDEIGLEFARFLDQVPGGSDNDVIEKFCAALRPGDPPEGQGLLTAAFRDYHRARLEAHVKTRSERMLLANLRIGLHEQTRLQPEIAEALNACLPAPDALRARLVELLAPGAEGGVTGLRRQARRTLVAQACELIAAHIRTQVRAVITSELMTLALPGVTLRLGRDVTGAFPDHLRRLEHPELTAFLATVDPTPDTADGSGTRDWAELADRMHFIADLFRTRHDDVSLLAPPFTGDQLQAVAEGRVPAGDL